MGLGGPRPAGRPAGLRRAERGGHVRLARHDYGLWIMVGRCLLALPANRPASRARVCASGERCVRGVGARRGLGRTQHGQGGGAPLRRSAAAASPCRQAVQYSTVRRRLPAGRFWGCGCGCDHSGPRGREGFGRAGTCAGWRTRRRWSERPLPCGRGPIHARACLYWHQSVRGGGARLRPGQLAGRRTPEPKPKRSRLVQRDAVPVCSAIRYYRP